MKSKNNFRELSREELSLVSGGVNMPGMLGGVYLAAQIGLRTGAAINSFNQIVSGMSLGEALYVTINSE